MKVKQLFALATLAFAASAVLADEAPGAPPTRAEVIRRSSTRVPPAR
jgi:hypothetical protein